jgi:hypothetical protein
MEFIDKTILATKAESIVSDFLNQLKIEGEPYPKDLYEIFKSAKNEDGIFFKTILTDLLLKEQSNHCCYCMRRLNFEDEEKTVEHLIPNKIDKNKTYEERKNIFEKYLNPNTVLNNKTVCFADDFIKNEETKFPPYPHTVAYHNLTISCNGKFSRSGSAIHCNLKRGDGYVKPFVLNSKVSEEFEYEPNGYVLWKDKDEKKKIEKKDALKKLELNIDRLRMIRRIWYYAVQNEENLMEFNNDQRKKFLIKLEKELPEDETNILNNFKTNDSYWNLLKKYDYFKLKFLARKFTCLTASELSGLIENIKIALTAK